MIPRTMEASSESCHDLRFESRREYRILMSSSAVRQEISQIDAWTMPAKGYSFKVADTGHKVIRKQQLLRNFVCLSLLSYRKSKLVSC